MGVVKDLGMWLIIENFDGQNYRSKARKVWKEHYKLQGILRAGDHVRVIEQNNRKRLPYRHEQVCVEVKVGGIDGPRIRFDVPRRTLKPLLSLSLMNAWPANKNQQFSF